MLPTTTAASSNPSAFEAGEETGSVPFAATIEAACAKYGLNPNLLAGLIEQPGVAAVTLTGSTPAGRSVAAKAGSVLKKQVLELGGSDAYVILDFPANYAKIGSALLRTGKFNGRKLFVAGGWPSTIPDFIRGGTPGNPLGVAALVMTGGDYAIHGTNRPGSVGEKRMTIRLPPS